MQRTFRAKKMIDRIKAEGREYQLTPQIIDAINKLDGKTGDDYNWESVVKGSPLVWIPADDDFQGAYVNVLDCD